MFNSGVFLSHGLLVAVWEGVRAICGGMSQAIGPEFQKQATELFMPHVEGRSAAQSRDEMKNEERQ
ncbi:hypothetical protein [Yoonia sp.]|uniref:hypothetical protein n=1 Tax=Yoonia sp. TaxID=2212373 RepID=UPI0025CBFB77|nr:hypothetical protein [Yoonia sp.]